MYLVYSFTPQKYYWEVVAEWAPLVVLLIEKELNSYSDTEAYPNLDAILDRVDSLLLNDQHFDEEEFQSAVEDVIEEYNDAAPHHGVAIVDYISVFFPYAEHPYQLDDQLDEIILERIEDWEYSGGDSTVSGKGRRRTRKIRVAPPGGGATGPYTIVLTRDANKGLRKLPTNIQKKWKDVVTPGLQKNPYENDGRDTSRAGGPRWKLRLGLHYRALFEIDDELRIVTVLKIGPREGFYT